MKKTMMLPLCLVALLFVVPVFAKPAGKSSIIQLYLVEKEPSGEWPTIEDGAWGKLTYNIATGKFVFNGHELEASEEYTLINFARVDSEWPATINVLGGGTANGGGNVHIAGNYAYADLEYDETPGSGSLDGYKIWLVLTEDLADETLAGWTPSEYLFESELI